MNQSPAFWRLTLSGLWHTAVLHLSRLYDTQAGALSLPTLLATIRANLDVFDEEQFRARNKGRDFLDSLAAVPRRPDSRTLDEDAASVAASEPLVTRLVFVRHKSLAHRDPRSVLGKLPGPLKALNDADVEALRERANTIVSRYTILFSASTTLPKYVGQDDFKYVLDHVRSDRRAIKRRIDRQIAKDLRLAAAGRPS